MRDVIVDRISQAIDTQAKHGLRVNGGLGPAWQPGSSSGFRAYVLAGRYAPAEPTYWAVAPDGRRFWMRAGMYTVWLSVERRLKAGRDLKTSEIAAAAQVSQGYVSKVLRKLEAFGFLTILGVFRGRWGRVIAKLRNQSFLPTYGKQGGMIVELRNGDRVDGTSKGWRGGRAYGAAVARYTDPWGSWLRACDRIDAAKAGQVQVQRTLGV